MTDEARAGTGDAADTSRGAQHPGAPPPVAAPDADARDAPPTTAAAVGAAGNPATGNSSSFRKQLGTQLSHMTDVFNDNLVVVRYATLSSVLLLGIYGVANTPLFYRYTNLLDIPSRSYLKRKWIHGRIIGVVEREGARAGEQQSRHASMGGTGRSMGREKGDAAPQSNQEPRPIVVLFRHSSPIERMLTQSAMDTLLSFTGKSPSRLLYSSANPHRNLFPIELAGVVGPPSNPASSILSHSLTGAVGSGVPMVDRLVEQKAKVALQLLARRTAGEAHDNTLGRETGEKRLPTDDEGKGTAICHLHYKKADQWISSTNVGLELVQEGQACINPNGTVVPTNIEAGPPSIADYDLTVKQLQADAQFMSKLEEAEYAAWTSKTGMWSSEQLRAMRREYAEEEESSKSAWRVWGWLKNGVGWVFRW